MATIKERLDFINALHQREISTMAAKSHDYSGNADCNRNISACAVIGLCSVSTGILVRLLDKFSRLSTLLADESSQQVKDESIDDTISDARNYLGILAHVRYESKKAKDAATPVQPPTTTT